MMRETEFMGYIVQFYPKSNRLNIVAPKGIPVKLFMNIRHAVSKYIDKVNITVNRRELWEQKIIMD